MDAKPDPTPTFRLDTVVERCVGNSQLAVKMLRRLGEQLEADVPRLAEAVARSAAGDVVETAHRIKGAAATLGIEGVRELAAWIEAAAKSGDLTAGADRIRDLEDEARRFRAEVEALAPTGGAADRL